VLTQFRAASAARARARRLLELGERADAAVVNRADDGALGHADASADGRALRHLGNIEADVLSRTGKKQVPAPRPDVYAASQPVHIAMAVRGVADEDETD